MFEPLHSLEQGEDQAPIAAGSSQSASGRELGQPLASDQAPQLTALDLILGALALAMLIMAAL